MLKSAKREAGRMAHCGEAPAALEQPRQGALRKSRVAHEHPASMSRCTDRRGDIEEAMDVGRRLSPRTKDEALDGVEGTQLRLDWALECARPPFHFGG